MFVNRPHSRYSVIGEVLCMLSQWSNPIKTIARDLGFENSSDVRDALGRLQQRGHTIVTERTDGLGITARLAGDIRDAKLEAEQYWAAVYGSD